MTTSVLDDVPGLGPDPQEAAAQGARLGEEAARARPRTSSWRSRGCPTGRRARVYAQLHGRDAAASDSGRRRMTARVTLDVTIITGMSGAGRSSRGRRARGPRLLRDRQPAADAHRQGRRARRAAPRAAALRARRRRALRRLPRRPRRRARRAARAWAHARACCSSTRPTTCSCAATRRAGAAPARRRPSASPTASPHERALLETLKGEADLVVDTSSLNVHELRDRLRELFADDQRRRRAADQHRVVRLQARPAARRRPRVRLPLPARTRTGSTSCARSPGTTRRCATTCSASPRRGRSSTSSTACSRCCCPAYEREGKSYLSIGVGCTGGRHRSVVDRRASSRERLAAARRTAPRVHHRDVDRDA